MAHRITNTGTSALPNDRFVPANGIRSRRVGIAHHSPLFSNHWWAVPTLQNCYFPVTDSETAAVAAWMYAPRDFRSSSV